MDGFYKPLVSHKTRKHSSKLRIARLLTVSRSIGVGGGGLGSIQPLPRCIPPACRPLWIQTPQMQRPLDADAVLCKGSLLPFRGGPPVVWPVMHAGKLTPSYGQTDRRLWKHYLPHFSVGNKCGDYLLNTKLGTMSSRQRFGKPL